MKVKIIISLLFFLVSFGIQGQVLKKTGSFNLPFEPELASIDQQCYLYFASKEGVIEKYNRQGELEYHYSPQKKARPTLMEAWQGLRVFVYYQAFQEYLFLNRFLVDSERFNLQRFDISQFSGLTTISGDNNLWLIDSNTLKLSKIDLESGETLLQNQLSLTLSSSSFKPMFIREYQNLLFISDENNGIFVFDNLGNFIETISGIKTSFFTFNKNNLVLTESNSILLIDIYSKTKREISTADLSYEKVFMENNQFFALSDKRVDILSIN